MGSVWLVFAFLSAVLISASSIVEKKTLLKQHAMEFSATVSIFTMIITLPFFFLFPIKPSVPTIIIIYVASLIGAVAFLLTAKAMRHIAISITSPLLVIAPLFTAILASIFLGEKITLLQGTGIIVLVGGAYLLESHSYKALFEPFIHFAKMKHIREIFLALLLYGVGSIIDKRIVGSPVDGGLGINVFFYIALAHFFTAINFILMLLIFHDGFNGVSHGLRHHWKISLAIAVLLVGSRLALQYSLSLPGVLVSLVIPIKRLSSLVSTVIGGGLFHEEHVLRRSLACLIMVIGAVLLLL
ncbi:EamA family transporter [Candidatus Woesearchaeota archaeon]|nr:EamA family transporter [Candidatus Woesearchaeota archaeon]